jgi:hypothetical protein
MAKQIQNLTFYIREITGQTIFFIKVLSKEQGAFMMRIVDGRFACYIMNTNRRSPLVFGTLVDFLPSVFVMKNVNAN